MIYSIKLLALFAIFLLNVKLAENKTVFSKHQEFPSATTSGSLMNSVASYVVCHDVELSSDEKYSRKCSITHGNMAEKNELSSCDITFLGNFTDDYTVHAVSADQALIVWCDDDDKNTEYLLRYTFVHLPDCKTAEAAVAFDDHETLSDSINRYEEAITFNKDGTYDVYFENPKFCGNKVCRLTIDSQGKKVKGPIALYVPFDKPIVVTEAMPVNNSVGIAELGTDTENTKVSLITPDGLKLLRLFPTEQWINNDFSISEGMIRSCAYKGNMKIQCENFDTSGKSLSKIDMDIINQHFYKLFLSNLPNGEFILLSESENGHHRNITKFDSNHKRLGTIELPKSSCENDSMFSSDTAYKENSENCVSSICYDSFHVDLAKYCFDDNEFK